MPKHSNMLSPTLMKGLKGQSKVALGKKSGIQTSIKSEEILNILSSMEAPYKDELEPLAIELVKEMFPVIDFSGYQLEAKLTTISDVNASLDEETKPEDQAFTDEQRRRMINTSTQGAAIKGTEDFQFKDLYIDYINSIDPKLLEQYAELTRNLFGVYHDESTVAMMLQMVQMGNKQGGGSSRVTVTNGISEATKKPVVHIKALGVCFPILIHEITKGVYEALSLHGFTKSKEENQSVADAVDTLENEVDDIRFGKFIHNAIINPYEQSQYKNDARVRDFLVINIYKLKDDFADYVRTALAANIVDAYTNGSKEEKKELQDSYNELMDPTVKTKWQTDWKKWIGWANGIMAQGDRYFKKKDTGLKGL